ncbi:hypothetical protein BMR85_010710, partial [Achromobacter sp. KAs 3-5]
MPGVRHALHGFSGNASKRTPQNFPQQLAGGFAYDAMQEDRKGYQNFTGAGPSRQLGVQGALRRDETNRVY